MQNFVSINDCTKEDLLDILSRASYFEKHPNQNLLQGKVVASLFFEPSTRTRLSFETAINRLGGNLIGFSDANTLSTVKGESFNDTIKMAESYADIIIIRHRIEGAAKYASEITNIPVINAGDGANQHPTQTILDMYSIQKTQNSLNELNIFIVGDLKYGRTVHSLVMAMSFFNPTFNFISPKSLQIPKMYKLFLKEKKINYYEHKSFTGILKKADILYMTRIQQERFADQIEYKKVKNIYILRKEMLDNTKDNLKILHPLPRINEIEKTIDTSPKAYYFTQALNGVYARQAIISKVLNINI